MQNLITELQYAYRAGYEMIKQVVAIAKNGNPPTLQCYV